MKAVMMLMCLLAVSLAGCSVWAYSDPASTDTLGLRTGYLVTENVEVGLSASQTPYGAEDEREYGAYSLIHLGGPYIGAQTNIGNGRWDQDTLQPVGGIILGPVFAEYQHEDLHGEEDKVVLGLRYKF